MAVPHPHRDQPNRAPTADEVERAWTDPKLANDRI
jgi:hypothetical protein